MKIAITLSEDGSLEDICSNETMPVDLEIFVIHKNLTNAQPDEIGRADGEDCVVIDYPAHKVDDRRYWRDVQKSAAKSSRAYYIRDGIVDTEGAIEGEAVEVITPRPRIS